MTIRHNRYVLRLI